MMASELPFVTAIIARLPDSKINLAAYGVAFSLALIIEAPVIMIMSASVALVTHKTMFLKLRRFIYTLNGMVTSIMVMVLIPPVFALISKSLFDLPDDVTSLTYKACLILLPWPAAIGYRRFYQGILIRHNLTRRVAYGTGIRLCTMVVTGAILFQLGIRGAVVGTAAITAGVFGEAVASRLMAYHTVKEILRSDSTEVPAEPVMSYGDIMKFYYPLALTAVLTLGVHPITIFFMGKSRLAIESLAVLPVVYSLLFLFGSIGMSYQEVGIALLGNKNQGYIPLRNFAVFISLALLICFSLLAYTPLAGLWFHHVSGLKPELARFAYLPIQILVLMPSSTLWNSFQRSILICGKMTRPVTWATAAEIFLIVTTLIVSIAILDLIGAVAVALALVIGRFGATLYMIPPCYSVMRKFR